AVREDVTAQVQWRGVRAIVLARQRRLKAAERLAREAVQLVAGTDLLNLHADALLDLGEVLRLARRKPEARAAVEQAVTAFEAKGNVVQSARARVSLKALSGRAKPSDELRIAG